VFIDPSTFGGKKPSNEIRTMLQMARIPTMLITMGDDIGAALAQRPI
jgi:hypothetical protein